MPAPGSQTAHVEAPGSQFDVAAIRAQFPVLAGNIAYLDTGASAQKPLHVVDEMRRFTLGHYANIHRGVYSLSQQSTAAYENARTRIAGWLGAEVRGTVFTKNVTEAINLVARSWGEANLGPGDQIVLTELEHHANLVPWQQVAKKTGAELVWLPVNAAGDVDLDPLDAALSAGRVRLVACAHVSNVMGTILPVEEIVRRAHAYDALVLIDGAQAVPQLPVDIAAIGADFYAWTGHKLYGPTGIGVLHARPEILDAMEPFLVGGDMIGTVSKEGTTWAPIPAKFEAGTPPIIEAVGLRLAVDWIDAIGMDAVRNHAEAITAYALARLAELPWVTIYGPAQAVDRGGLVAFTIDDVHPHDVSEVLAREGVCVRAGQHCAEPLTVALGVPSTTRASFGVHTNEADIDALIDGLNEVRRIFS